MIIEPNDPFPYDTMFKKSMKVKEVARDFLEQMIPEEIQKYLDLDSFALEKNEFADNTIGKGFVDVIFSVKMKNKITYINVLIESQSTEDNFMPVRIHKYKSLIYESHRKKYPNSKHIPSIIPIVFYTFERAKKNSNKLSDLTQDPAFEEIIQSFGNIEYYLPEIPDEKIIQKENLAPMMMLTKYAKSKNLTSAIKKIDKGLINISSKNSLYFEDCLVYTLKIGHHKDKQAVIDLFKEYAVSEKQKETVMNIAQKLVQEGVEEGMAIGEANGEIKAKMEIARSMIVKGFDLETISHITKLPIQKIKELY